MTIIVALKDGEKVWMGSDRMRMYGSNAIPATNSKVWKTTDVFGNVWAWGSAGSTNLSQVTRYQVRLPEKNVTGSEDISGFIFTEYLPRLYQHLKDFGGIVRPDPKVGENAEGTLLIGLHGKIYRIAGLSVTELDCPFVAIGLGDGPAFGALNALQQIKAELSPKERIKIAIKAACEFNPNIGGGMDIVHT
jgi:ATP-dependent protease HslVU (ClpYQ) peptidase subunit